MARILVVEDEPHLAMGLRFNLEADGHAVDVAADCQPSASVIGVAFATPTLVSGSYVSNQVTFSNIHASCNGRLYKIRFLGTGNTPLGASEASGTVTGTSLNVPLTGISQNDVVRIAMTIY